MPARPRTAAQAAAAVDPELGWFERLEAEATKDLPKIEPFVIPVDPPIEIQPPTSIEQRIKFDQLFDRAGNFHVADTQVVLEALCGDAFGRVWEGVRRKHERVAIRLIQQMLQHFERALVPQAEDAGQGGSGASST
jgi:hypothetical protein